MSSWIIDSNASFIVSNLNISSSLQALIDMNLVVSATRVIINSKITINFSIFVKNSNIQSFITSISVINSYISTIIAKQNIYKLVTLAC